MSEIVLKRRPPAERLRYILQKLEKQAIEAGQFPLLIHEALEALDQLVGATMRPEAEEKRS